MMTEAIPSASRSSRSVEEIASYLSNNVTAEAWEEGQPNEATIKKWAKTVKKSWDKYSASLVIRGVLVDKIKDDQLDDTVQKLVDCLQVDGKAVDQKERQFVGISHGVTDTKLTHNFDVNQLKGRIDDVFKTFYDHENEGGYYAPYLCFVQSSGMGKTKIMYELCKYYNSPNDETQNENALGRLILCRSPKSQKEEGDKERKLFHHFLDLNNDNHRNQNFQKVLDDVFAKLDAIIKDFSIDESVGMRRVVLFFDEAHYLLGVRDYAENKKSMEAMLFRIVRLWICKRRVCLQIVAIFTGTTAKLTNFIISDDLRSDLKTDSRAHGLNHEKRFYQIRGRRSYEPFYTTTTVGCLRFAKSDSSGQQSEYITAVPRGRPLFAVLTEDELKLGEPSIAQRIVQESPSDLDENESAWLSVLGTRVQDGTNNF